MFVYFRIKYLEANELDIEQQVEIMRNYVEKICKLPKAGLKYKGHFSREFINEDKEKLAVAVVKYYVLKKVDIVKIETTMKNNEVLGELLVYVSVV